MKRRLMALMALTTGLVLAATTEAFTQTKMASMNITATILAQCSVSTTPMDFGNLSPTLDTSTTSTITVNCSNGVPYRIDIDAGTNYYTSSGMARYLKEGTLPADSTNTVAYRLFQEVTHNTLWGDEGVTFCPACTTPAIGKSGTGTGAAQIHTVFGMANIGVNGPGLYSDTVTVTVNY